MRIARQFLNYFWFAVRELGLRDSDDGSIWSFAAEGNWTVVTKRTSLPGA
jgi:predicted nuclease of predicted toxin-antitoxin system